MFKPIPFVPPITILDFIVDPWNPGPGFREGSNNITDEQLRELANKAKVTKNF